MFDFSPVAKGKWIALGSNRGWLSAGSLHVRPHVEHGVFLGNMDKATFVSDLLPVKFHKQQNKNCSAGFHRGKMWKWKRPVKAASVSCQTSAPLKHLGLFNQPLSAWIPCLPRARNCSAFWEYWDTDGGCYFTPPHTQCQWCALPIQTSRNIIPICASW